ncbi:MAG: twin-arginine translocase subunit TatC [Phaeodactylibacter sp.]|nr:twin-arginine translocase subunit TatC [Phaeodactylibacter sp.]MCB9294865.1 twin-arginine translocase subunit TatC [Lewinellaceae bacterium]
MAANKEFIVRKKKSLSDRLSVSKNQPELNIWDELEKLRWHIIRSLAVISAAGIIFFCYQKWLFTNVVFAPAEPGFITYRLSCAASKLMGAGELACLEPPVFSRLAIGFGEPFIISIQVSFLAGLLATFPYLLLEIGSFIKPFIPEGQRKSVTDVVGACSLLFFTGVAFGYYLLAPVSISWLMGFTVSGVENTPTLSSYINYMLIFTLPMGLIFQVPVICYFLARLGLLSAEDMRTYRRHAIVGILLAAGIITPTVDGLTQILVAFPLYLLFEASIFIVAKGRRAYETES